MSFCVSFYLSVSHSICLCLVLSVCGWFCLSVPPSLYRCPSLYLSQSLSLCVLLSLSFFIVCFSTHLRSFLSWVCSLQSLELLLHSSLQEKAAVVRGQWQSKGECSSTLLLSTSSRLPSSSLLLSFSSSLHRFIPH